MSVLYGTLLLVYEKNRREGAKLLGYDRQTDSGSNIMYVMNAKLYDHLFIVTPSISCPPMPLMSYVKHYWMMGLIFSSIINMYMVVC